MLLPVSDAKANESYALRLAALNGREECVRLLLPVSDPKALDSKALMWAANNGHVECVRLLLPVSGPLCEIEMVLRAVIICFDRRNHEVDPLTPGRGLWPAGAIFSDGFEFMGLPGEDHARQG